MPYSLKKKRAEAAVAEKQKHYERLLREQAGESDLPEKSEEGLLEEQRTGKEAKVTTEAQLDSVRSETNEAITEKRLDTEKPAYGCVNRCDSLDGSDVPLLEGKRLASKDVMENEKYDRANNKPKK